MKCCAPTTGSPSVEDLTKCCYYAPTDLGKSLCYILFPSVFDQLRKVERKSIALVVSPLVALMQDQVAAITAIGISAIDITDKHTKTTENSQL